VVLLRSAASKFDTNIQKDHQQKCDLFTGHFSNTFTLSFSN